MSDAPATVILALKVENAELRQQLASAQDMLVETAIQAGELRAEIAALRTKLAATKQVRDAWRAEVLRRSAERAA